MRQLIISVPQGKGEKVLEMARAHAGVNLAQIEATDAQNPIDLVLVHVSNKRVEGLIGQLETIADMRVTLLPSTVMALYPPADAAPDQIKEVQERSPIEVFLAGLQSVGSWRGFLAYAAAAAVVVWIGLLNNTSYLLVAAMLIAPFAGPAMNTAIATARGDWRLLWRSLVRYFAAIATTVAVAALLTLIINPDGVSNLIIDTSKISAITVLLPLAAGAAGSIHLMQSEQSSLVSGAAVGILIAASLAPPAGIVGIAPVIGRYDIALRGLFLLLLQLVGINLSAALIFRSYGLSSSGARYNRGRRWLFPMTLGVTTLALIGLLTWQFVPSVSLERSSLEQQASVVIQDLVQTYPDLTFLTAEVQYTQATSSSTNTLLAIVYVQEEEGSRRSRAATRQALSTQIKTELEQVLPSTTPLVDVNVLQP